MLDVFDTTLCHYIILFLARRRFNFTKHFELDTGWIIGLCEATTSLREIANGLNGNESSVMIYRAWLQELLDLLSRGTAGKRHRREQQDH